MTQNKIQNYLSDTDKLFEEKFITNKREDGEDYTLYLRDKDIKSFLHQRQVGLVEVVIELIQTHTEKEGSYCDTGDDMEWACRSNCVRLAVERLKNLELIIK